MGLVTVCIRVVYLVQAGPQKEPTLSYKAPVLPHKASVQNIRMLPARCAHPWRGGLYVRHVSKGAGTCTLEDGIGVEVELQTESFITTGGGCCAIVPGVHPSCRPPMDARHSSKPLQRTTPAKHSSKQ